MIRAFTLVETIIVIALFVVVMFGAMQLYLIFGRVIIGQESTIDVTLDSSTLVDAVRHAGAQASQVVASHTFSGVSYNSGTTTAIFKLPAIDSSGALIAGSFDYVGIHASGTEAYRFIDGAQGSARTSGTKLLANTLKALRFTYDNGSFPLVTSVVTDATTSALVRGQDTQRHLRGVVHLRNL